MAPNTFAFGLTLALGLSFVISPAKADQASSALRGKSLVLTWTANWTQQDYLTGGSLGPSYTAAVSNTANVYVGLQGHIFGVAKARSRKLEGRTNYSDPSGPTGAIAWRFQNDALVGDWSFTRGARRVEVTFLDGFSQCMLRVIYGKIEGRPMLTKSLDRARDHLVSDVSVSAANCSIRDGNIFDASH
jgi:hypothetical protein